jgi:hypothetical protein
MKGLYILLLVVAGLAVLGYLAFKDTDSDLRRQHEILLSQMDAIETRLKDAIDPLTRLRSRKATNRLDKNYSSLTMRADKMRRDLNAMHHHIETVDDRNRADVAEGLERKRLEVDALFAEVNTFSERLDVIDRFVAESHPLKIEIAGLADAIEKTARARALAGDKLSPELQDRVEDSVENSKRVLKLAADSLVWIWQDIEQGRALADHTVSEMRKCLPTLETLYSELKSTGGQ